MQEQAMYLYYSCLVSEPMLYDELQETFEAAWMPFITSVIQIDFGNTL